MRLYKSIISIDRAIKDDLYICFDPQLIYEVVQINWDESLDPAAVFYLLGANSDILDKHVTAEYSKEYALSKLQYVIIGDEESLKKWQKGQLKFITVLPRKEQPCFIFKVMY